jgi:putative peptide zinc metalloprotease protein
MIASNYSVISSNSSNLLSLNLLLYIITFHFGSIFHELGHATACSKFGAKLGGIGFGFYIFFPVLFADVSDAWRLPKSQRIIVNLGGLYFEMIIATILLIIYLFNHQTPYLVIPCVLMIHTLYNLNPLIKYDGYWVLSDATDTPNLHEKSFTRLKSLLKRFFLKVKGYKFEKKDLFLVTYGFMSVSFIFFFLAMALIIDPDSVIKLPINLFNYINDNSNITLQGLGQFFLPAIFWILVVKMVIQGIIKIIRKQKIRKKTALA